jgi:cell fate regulator YaaT (PSP1 superfamily)
MNETVRPLIVGIRFKRAGRIYYFDPAGHELDINDHAVVETSRGTEVGRVAIAPRQVAESDVAEPLKPVLRMATAADLMLQQHYKGEEGSALKRCQEEIARYNMPMKLVGAEYNYDGTRLSFFFTSESRVDLRDLVKELAVIFKTRNELRQIGARDEAKAFGGLGRCGRPLCCNAFLGDFASVSIRMAKDQDLPLNPMKISGCCGRLLCCLGYENDAYCQLRQALPRLGQTVTTRLGPGVVTAINVIKATVVVELSASLTRTEFPAADLGAAPPPGAAEVNALARPGSEQVAPPPPRSGQGGAARITPGEPATLVGRRAQEQRRSGRDGERGRRR